MGRKAVPRKLAREDVADHHATLAWTACAGSGSHVLSLEHLKESRNKTNVYRLELEQAEPKTVIAKWKPFRKDLELEIYKYVLAAVGLPSVGVYGEVGDPSTTGYWVFLEDLGDQKFSPFSRADRRLVSEWLATLHQWRAFTSVRAILPNRGHRWYLQALHSAREAIRANLTQPWVTDRGLPTLTRILTLLERLERNWSHIEQALGSAPQIMAHGDLVSKNTRLRNNAGIQEMVVLDWDTAGLGVPGIDLASLPSDLEHYAGLMQPVWPEMSPSYVMKLAEVGRMFRSLAELEWKTCDLEYPWCSVESFESFEGPLQSAARTMESIGAM
jgi:Phosphotransferase enzyme family